jgi:hypothetical protein
VRSGPGAARTILLFHTISARPPKQPRMVRAFLQVHTRPRLALNQVPIHHLFRSLAPFARRCVGFFSPVPSLSGAHDSVESEARSTVRFLKLRCAVVRGLLLSRAVPLGCARLCRVRSSLHRAFSQAQVCGGAWVASLPCRPSRVRTTLSSQELTSPFTLSSSGAQWCVGCF